jgi:hypothetical protein
MFVQLTFTSEYEIIANIGLRLLNLNFIYGSTNMNTEHKKHLTHFKVDGEPYQTEDNTLKPNFIISHFAEMDPANHYLVRIKKGVEKESFKDEGDKDIKIHEGDCFIVVPTGATPVSDFMPWLV